MFDPTLEPEHPFHWQRVLRGGSWNNNPNNLRSANRNNNTTGNRNNNNGFRLASTLINRTSVFTEAEAGIESSGVLGKSTGSVGVLSFLLTPAALYLSYDNQRIELSTIRRADLHSAGMGAPSCTRLEAPAWAPPLGKHRSGFMC